MRLGRTDQSDVDVATASNHGQRQRQRQRWLVATILLIAVVVIVAAVLGVRGNNNNQGNEPASAQLEENDKPVTRHIATQSPSLSDVKKLSLQSSNTSPKPPSSLVAALIKTSSNPSDSPSDVPSDAPSDVPSDVPSQAPSDVASQVPTNEASESPSQSRQPTLQPSRSNDCSSASCCNGADICDVPVKDVLFAMLHNAHSTLEDGFWLGFNHENSLEKALGAGYRGLNLDMGRCGGSYKLIHGPCFLGTRDPATVFANIDAFLDNNPNEILLITMQLNDVDLNEVYSIMSNAGNFVNRLHVHQGGEWPTLQALIDQDKRILLFHFNGPECDQPDQCPPGLHKWFAFASETQFNFDSVDDFADPNYACQITRGGGTADFFGVNAFLLPLPSRTAARTLNTRAWLENHVEGCAAFNNLDVNVISVDFWQQGNLVELVQLRNDLVGQQARRRQRRQLRVTQYTEG